MPSENLSLDDKVPAGKKFVPTMKHKRNNDLQTIDFTPLKPVDMVAKEIPKTPDLKSRIQEIERVKSEQSQRFPKFGSLSNAPRFKNLDSAFMRRQTINTHDNAQNSYLNQVFRMQNLQHESQSSRNQPKGLIGGT